MYKRQVRQAELQHQYELTRWWLSVAETFYINVNRRKGQSSKMIKPTDIATFPWEQKAQATNPHQSLQELAAEINRLDAKYIESQKQKQQCQQ